jgi:hypothetical protein
MNQKLLAVATLALVVAAQTATSTAPAGGAGQTSISLHGSKGVLVAAGAGHYALLEALDAEFAFLAVQIGKSKAFGFLRHRTEDATGTIDFDGAVTCLAVDSANNRAWIGGVITANRSTSPAFLQPQHQVGHDIWFRVLDNGHDEANPDRTTFVGFETLEIPSSEVYCQIKIWPDVPVPNARTWRVTSGDLIVRP